MPQDRSVDIDSNFDFKFVKFTRVIDSGISNYSVTR